MRQLFTSIIIMMSIVLVACNSSDELKPIKEETTDFSLETARNMILDKEKIIIDIASMDDIPNKEYIEIEKSFHEAFGDHGNEMLSMFVIQSDQQAELDSYQVNKESFYPTILHEEIEITDAVVSKTYYENEFFNQTFLTIKEQYTGDDRKLKDWEREYIFIENEAGEWEIQGFSGVMNFVGEGFHNEYLKLKD